MGEAQPTLEDYQAADEVIAKRTIPEKEKPKAREFLAVNHANWGHDKFLLRLGLREPVCSHEKLEIALFRREISRDEFLEQIRKLVTRPVDSEMIRTYYECLEDKLEHYSKMLMQISENLRPSRNESHDEITVTEHAEEMSGKQNLFGEEIGTVEHFLEESRVEQGLPLPNLLEFRAGTATKLAFDIMDYAQQGWENCLQVAERSRTDLRYTRATTASELFREVWSPTLPAPSDVSALLRQESGLARLALRRQEAEQVVSTPPEQANPENATEEASDTEVPNTFRQRGEMWQLAYEGSEIFLKESLGLKYLRLLLQKPNRIFTALELKKIVADSNDKVAAGSSGKAIDQEALRNYRLRHEELEDLLAEAKKNNDTGGQVKYQTELEQIASEICSATGLGGRIRDKSDLEGARIQVKNAIDRARKKIVGKHPALERHLTISVDTGMDLFYRPEKDPGWIT